jgi:hypothetical protein
MINGRKGQFVPIQNENKYRASILTTLKERQDIKFMIEYFNQDLELIIDRSILNSQFVKAEIVESIQGLYSNVGSKKSYKM